ncbi:hypothetical protein BJ944DRAFT_269309 [Cunninghamella echinulata]|nr:hypothetical protein BJ944DRAFT_269309 [Cunninghamella echinulata]
MIYKKTLFFIDLFYAHIFQIGTGIFHNCYLYLIGIYFIPSISYTLTITLIYIYI